MLKLQNLFADVRLKDLSLDVRSTALWTFLSSDVRKSFGIFTTPEDVVRAMIEVLVPKSTDVVLDPACGTGTFLMETGRFIANRQSQGTSLSMFGIDKNPRMLLLANLNIGYGSDTLFKTVCMDALRDLGKSKSSPFGLFPNSVDVILTNPPFGVTVTQETGVLDLFGAYRNNKGKRARKISSEVLFVDLCLNLLKPGGRMGIILPRGVMTNERIDLQRRSIDRLGFLTTVIELPPETFASTGTQTTTVAAFFQKHSQKKKANNVTVRVCHVTNVGFDTTGRRRDGNQLPLVAGKLAQLRAVREPIVTTHSDVHPNKTLQCAAEFLFQRNGSRTGKKLREFIELANTGRTPGRSAYTDDGVFILKVGNLTGRGIDWEPRDRNFISHLEWLKRRKNMNLTLQKGDILLTSSAHTARYIAKKVDIVAQVPNNYAELTFVGELMRLRPKPEIDPFLLLASLRHPMVREDLQASVRGQTAHLNPRDLLNVTVPYNLLKPEHQLVQAADLFQREAALAFEMNEVAAEASILLQS